MMISSRAGVGAKGIGSTTAMPQPRRGYKAPGRVQLAAMPHGQLRPPLLCNFSGYTSAFCLFFRSAGFDRLIEGGCHSLQVTHLRSSAVSPSGHPSAPASASRSGWTRPWRSGQGGHSASQSYGWPSVCLPGSYTTLDSVGHADKKQPPPMICGGFCWCNRRDSNARPLASEANALSN